MPWAVLAMGTYLLVLLVGLVGWLWRLRLFPVDVSNLCYDLLLFWTTEYGAGLNLLRFSPGSLVLVCIFCLLPRVHEWDRHGLLWLLFAWLIRRSARRRYAQIILLSVVLILDSVLLGSPEMCSGFQRAVYSGFGR